MRVLFAEDEPLVARSVERALLLLARVRALCRRSCGTKEGQLRVSDVTLDPARHEVWRDAPGAGSKMVEVYSYYLRNKIDGQTSRPLVRTVHGVGYMVDG